MPRKARVEQAGRFRSTSKRRSQWPGTSNWGNGPFAERAVERWLVKRDRCWEPACEACRAETRRIRIRTLYARRKR